MVIARPGVAAGLACWLLAAVLWCANGPHPAHTLAQAIPIPAATTNPYWAGFVTAGNGPYSAVHASWEVPASSCSAGPRSTVYTWIGEGGYLHGLSSPLIQAGTGVDCLAGKPRYHAFYEWYPGIYATDFPVAVGPGDKIQVRIDETQPDYWVISFDDTTNGARATTATNFHPDTSTADFIAERPTVCLSDNCQQGNLAPFHAVAFTSIQTMSGGRSLPWRIQDALPVALVDPATGHVLAQPGHVSIDASTLAVLWRQIS